MFWTSCICFLHLHFTFFFSEISKIISKKLTIAKQEIGKLREENNNLKKVPRLLKIFLKIKFQMLSRTFANLKGKLRKLTKMQNTWTTAENIRNKLVKLEDCPRRNNIRINGVNEDSKESGEEYEKKVHLMLKERLEIQNVEIERVKRVERKTKNRSRTIVCKLLRFKDKQNILRKAKILKGTDTFINENSCKDRV